jgi:hypothetical protein
LNATASDARLRALIGNDLATLNAVNGEFDAARQGLEAALAIDESCRPARLNLELLVNRLARFRETACDAEASAARAEPCPPGITLGHVVSNGGVKPEAGLLRVVGADWEEPAGSVAGMLEVPGASRAESSTPIRVAILSFLFNWPSTGGGNIHTVELATFLGRAGYEVRHIYVRYPEWEIGRVGDGLPFRSEALEFDASGWNVNEIKDRYRRAVRSFDPDYVIITDAWNMKPVLAEAVEGFPYYLRFQALECLCPLNNLRLLARSAQAVEQCHTGRHRTERQRSPTALCMTSPAQSSEMAPPQVPLAGWTFPSARTEFHKSIANNRLSDQLPFGGAVPIIPMSSLNRWQIKRYAQIDKVWIILIIPAPRYNINPDLKMR